MKTKKKYPLCEKKYYLEKKFVNPYVFFNELSNITNANFDGSNLIGATWTNGQTCGPDSISVCNIPSNNLD